MPQLFDYASVELELNLNFGISCVVGVPGSGKTTQLVKAVLELEKSIEPDRILVLTPTRSAAAKLRDQIALASKLPSSAARARSLASFAFEQVTKHSPGLKLMSGPNQQQLLASLLAQAQNTKDWGLNPKAIGLAAFAQELRDLIQVVMEFGLSTEDLSALWAQYPELKLAPALETLPRYLAELSATGTLDPAALITQAKQSVDGQFDWVLVDDAQDLSTAGLGLIQALSRHSRVLLFGDPDAGVLGFRSAEPGEFLRFGNIQILSSGPVQSKEIQVLMSRFAQKLAPAGAGRQRAVLATAELSPTAQIFSSTSAESDALAAKLRRLRLEQKISFSEMAVVLRTQSQVAQLSRELSARNVPVRVTSASEPLGQNQLTRAILETCELALQRDNHGLIKGILGSSFIGLTSIELRRLERQLVHQLGMPINQAWEHVLGHGFEFESPEARVLNGLLDIIRKVETSEITSAHQLVSLVWEFVPKKLKTLALGSSEIALAANRDLDAGLRLFAAAVRFDESPRGGLAEFVNQQLQLTIAEDTLAKFSEQEAVLVTTASALPAQSFRVVALPRLQDGIWPNLRPRNSLLGATSLRAFLSGRTQSPLLPVRSELADEIRLFYKALGSAREQVIVSAMKSPDEQPSQFFAIGKFELSDQVAPVDFDLRRLVGRLRAQLKSGDQSAAGLLAGFALAGVPGADPANWQGLLAPSSQEAIFSQDESIHLSASSLEAFERCPLHWFIKTFAVGQSSFQASIGTLLHSAFELATNPEDLLTYLESNWHTLEFENSWQAASQKRRALEMAILAGNYLRENPAAEAIEQGFEIEHGRLLIRGKIDRIERTPTGLVVADLKTGKTNLDAKGNLQLAVYQLAVSKLMPNEIVEGARLVSVGTGKLKISDQPPLDSEALAELTSAFDRFLAQGKSPELVANVTEHCAEDGSCKLLLARGVSDG